MGTQNIFQRYEMKYLLTRSQKERLLADMLPYIEPDRYSHYTINNLYFDTASSYLIRNSLEKPSYKEKLRLRSYGVATPNQTVFLELKKKYKHVVYKRRITLSEKEAMTYLLGRGPLPQESQIGHEIDYFMKFYGDLAPAVALSYDREAYSGLEDSELRVTFDDRILFRETDLSLCAGIYGYPILNPNTVLMELKVPGVMPLWLSHLLTKHHVQQTSFSKYGAAYQYILQSNGGRRYA